MKKPYLSIFEIILDDNISASTITRSLEDSDNDNNLYGRTITKSLEDTDNDIIPTLETICKTKTNSIEEKDTSYHILDLLSSQ